VLFEKKLALLPGLQHDFPFPSQCTFFSATEDDFAVAALPSLAWLPLSVVLSVLVLEEEAWLQEEVPLWQSREGDSFTSDLEVVFTVVEVELFSEVCALARLKLIKRTAAIIESSFFMGFF